MSVDVSVPSLTALSLSGSGQISATEISTPQLTVTISGSGLVSAAGTATRLDVTINGNGKAQLSQLNARYVHAVITGSGLIQVIAMTSLDAAVPGSGTIIYSGNPAQVTTSVTGDTDRLAVVRPHPCSGSERRTARAGRRWRHGRGTAAIPRSLSLPEPDRSATR